MGFSDELENFFNQAINMALINLFDKKIAILTFIKTIIFCIIVISNSKRFMFAKFIFTIILPTLIEKINILRHKFKF